MNSDSDCDCNELISTRRPRLCGVAPLPRSISLRRRLMGHHRLRQPPLQLSVLKLDGSNFEVWVRKRAIVAELKQAVEGVFMQSTCLMISWTHVWGNFCLSHKGQNLMDDKARIDFYGIKDGDQLRFVRHLSNKGNIEKMKKKHSVNAPEIVAM